MAMRNDSRLRMARYAEAARAHHDSNSDHEHAMYERDIDALGLHPATNQHIIDNGMADVVGHLHANTSERMRIAALQTSDKQIPEVQKIHAGENAEPDPDSSEATDGYLNLRLDAIRSGDRKVSNRERRAALRR